MLSPSNELILCSSTEETKRAVVLMHGYAQNMETMRPIADNVTSHNLDFAAVLLDGFRSTPAGFGYQWFDTFLWNINDWQREYNASLSAFSDYIESLADRLCLNLEDITLTGFSQGAIIALQVGLRLQVGCIASIGGVLMDETVLDGRSQRTRILMVQGGVDPIVPIEAMNKARDNFLKYGYNVEYCVIPGGVHIVDHRAIEIVSNFISK